MVARRHHYVPKFYLRGFTVERKKKRQINVFDGKDRKIFTTAVDNVGQERDFNKVEIEGLKPDAFENAMSGLEGKISNALDRIIATKSIAIEEDRIALTTLICAVAIRNPRIRESTRDSYEQAFRQSLNETLSTPEQYAAKVKELRDAESPGNPPEFLSYEKMKTFAKETDFTIQVPTSFQIMLEVEAFDKALPVLLRRKWMLLKATDDSGGFITSDHPALLTWSGPEIRAGPHETGFGMPGTHLIFPVSTRLAVIGAFEYKEGATIDAGEDIVANLNGAQVAYSERQVYARDHNFRYAMRPNESPRKASKLIDDKSFRKPRQESAEPISAASVQDATPIE